MNRKSDHSHRLAPAGFTLIELMVSIALVLILILGINQVFKIASDTVNVGQAMSGAAREDRAIQGTLGPDVQNMVLADAPFFIIRSRVQPAFRSRADEQADRDGDPYTVDIDGNNKEGEANIPGEKIGALTYTSRNHRLDRLMFFSNYRYRRQTGATANELISDMSSNEAYLWYGHLKLGRNNPTDITHYFIPGEADKSATNRNDNNRYATDWTLGRVVTLLSETPVGVTIPPGRLLRNGKGLAPLAESSQSQDGRFIHESRYDVANTSMSTFRGYLSRPGENWPILPWWDSLSVFRFQAYPYPTRPLNGDSMARTVPIFVRGCTQFIVEYAGDYLLQDEIGLIRGTAFSNPPTTDGVIDYVVVNGARRTRWYGAPRNVDTGDDLGGPVIVGTGPVNKMLDVVPLRDVLKSNGVSGVTIDPVDFIEREIDRRLPSKPNYAAIAGNGRAQGGAFTSPVMGNGAPKTGDEYVAAWGPSATGTYEHLGRGSRFMPKLLRITLVVDDPAGRLTEGQTYEYVFKLPG